MADSKILPFQNAKGDGLIDVCDEVIAPEELGCPECTPNPAAVVPDWLKRNRYEPFLNEQICKYQITITTDETTTGSSTDATEEEALAALEEIYREYEEPAIKALLLVYDKDNSEASMGAIKKVIEYTQYDLDVRPKSRLKLLYSIPKDSLDALDEAEEEAEGTEEEGGDEAAAEAGDIEATFVAAEMGPMMMRVRKTLRLYNRYLKTYRAVDNSNLLFLEDNSVFPLEIYGDWGGGYGANEVMAKVLPQLDGFLNTYGYNIANVGGLLRAGSGVWDRADRLTEITFTFDGKYRIKKLRFYTEGCGEKPIVFNRNGKLEKLMAESAWKDRTAMAYLVSLREMDAEIQARIAPNWIALLKKYTYPEIYETDTVVYETQRWGLSCVGEALINGGKQLGQDLFDVSFSLGDAMAWKFHDELCKRTTQEATNERIELGMTFDAEFNLHGENETLLAMASEQAFKELEDQDLNFISVCAALLAIATARFAASKGAPEEITDELYERGLEDLKLCGLIAAITEVLECLMRGLTLEETLAIVASKALRAMSINNFGDLFIGLPAEKREELSALVQQKLESGDVFQQGSGLAVYSDQIASNTESAEWSDPWEDPSLSESDKNKSSDQLQDTGTTDETRTLMQTLDIGSEENRNKLSSKVVLEAYIQALLEVYQDNLLELIDELNKFPGAQTIAWVIAQIDCPRPPFFNPSILDFIKDIELPFCRSMDEITLPELNNPFGWFPRWIDLIGSLQMSFMFALQGLVIEIIMKIFVKICELISNALCRSLGALNPLCDSNSLADMFKEGLCGNTADQQTINDTVVDMIGSVGVGGAAFADQEQTMAFAEDIGCAVSRKELAAAMLGEMPDEMADAIVSLVEHEYPDYEDALPHTEAVKSFFTSMGNVLPADFKETLRDFVDELPENDMMPAHPSLCATPEQIEQFCELRAELLADRATPAQITEMCDNLRETMKGDYEVVYSAQNWDEYVESNMPPLVSDPGCDNGLLPFEPDVAIQTITAALGNDLEQLKVDYSTDMLGNGPLQRNWGLINMIMSDTMGKPLTVHNRYVARKKRVVDFYTGLGSSDSFLADKIGDLTGGQLSSFISGDPAPSKQRGAYPTSVAEYLRQDMEAKGDRASDEAIVATINNEWVGEDSQFMDMKQLGFTGIFGRDLDLLAIPDLGYNIELEPEFKPGVTGNATGVNFIEKARKATSDLGVLEFRDNAKGLLATDESTWSYGFDMEVYFGDLVEDESGRIVNRSDDNVRIKITDQLNMGADMDNSAEELLGNTLDPDGDEYKLRKVKRTDQIIPNLRYEFLAVDDTLLDAIMPSSLNKMYDPSPADLGIPKELNVLDQYPDFLETFQSTSAHAPQTVLLSEMINKENDASVSTTVAKSFRDDALTAVAQMVFAEIAANTKSWAYGAEYDTLSVADIEYGIYEEGVTYDSAYPGWTPYSEYRIVEEDGKTRKLRNRDMRLGMSFNQYLNEHHNDPPTPEDIRVFYLDPMMFGSNYMNPGIYIKPLKNEGWLGMVDVLFPDLSACKPQSTDLVDFGSIQEIVDEIYPSIPEDERLKGDPDCIIERPYHRILMRSAKAGLVGLITAACRIYASTHIIKALPAYTTFSPIIPDTFSSACASYVVETMEASFKDAGGGPEWANAVFSDVEFWYAFLEQSVQLYAAMVDEGRIDPPPTVLEACMRINDMQEEYEYPDKPDLKAARKTREASRLQSLKSFRQDMNLEAIRETEEDAKLVLKQWVVEALNLMGEKLRTNMKRLNMAPVVPSLDYYVMDKMCAGSSLTMNDALKPDGTFDQGYVNLPIVPFEDTDSDDLAYDTGGTAESAYYTAGAEFVVGEDLDEEGLSKGEEYIGYYHVVIDEDGNPTWMAGDYHSDEEEDTHDILYPLVDQITVEIGDVPELGTAITVRNAADPTQLFAIEKYIYIEGHGRLTTSAAIDKIKTGDLTRNIADVFPGTLQIVTDEAGNDVGLEGQLGVRYGVQFSVFVEGISYEITAVEVDALDLPLSEFTTLTKNSKLLLCLLNLLKQDEKFKLMTRYIIPLNKLTAVGAIYTDMALLPSIGELTVETGQTFEAMYVFKSDSVSDYESGTLKPGTNAVVDVDFDEDPPFIKSVDTGPVSDEVAGYWSSKRDRDVVSLFWKHFDEWDQVMLRNSSGRIKRLFKTYYRAREFSADDIGKALKEDGTGPGQLAMDKLRAALKPAPGKRLLPKWRRRKLRSNPFNANGDLCEK